MEISNLIPHIEALIFASDKPLTAAEITELINQAFGFMDEKLMPEQIDAALEGIVEKYNSEFYPFEVKQSGGGWQFLTKKDFHKTVAQLNGEKFLKRLSAAALETLAIIAYKQPITKGEIEAIRGVSSDYSVQKLLEKELIIISGRNEKLPGHPLVYSTSRNFMDYFGINSPEDLPKIREVLAEQLVEPTIVNHTEFEQSGVLAVSNDGELIGADKVAEQTGETTPEEHINGHAFEIVIEDDEDESDDEVDNADMGLDGAGENEMDEEAIEEYITDTEFVKGDEEEEIKEIISDSETDEESDEEPGSAPPDENREKEERDEDTGI